MERFVFEENGLFLTMEVSSAGEVRLMHLGLAPDAPDSVPKAEKGSYSMVQLQCLGENQDGRYGTSHIHTQPGTLLRYLSHQDVRTPQGRKLMITQTAQDLYVTSYVQFYDGIPAIRCWTVVRNTGTAPQVLSHVSSFALTGLDRGPWSSDALTIPRNHWQHELCYEDRSLRDWGLSEQPAMDTMRIMRCGTGTLPSCEHLPAGLYQNAEYALSWQIEHQGSWMWEIAPQAGRLSLQLSGPSFQESHWLRQLLPGESFTSIPVAVALGRHRDAALDAMTLYRRQIRRPNEDNIKLPIVFNDGMLCLPDGPGAEQEMPLIEAAARAGCEAYCLNAGWHAAGPWWDGIGEWQPSPARFPGGLGDVVEAIRERGMIPGLWLELEVIGIHSPLVERIPQSWFFQIKGIPLISHGRYQLDFRNPEVVGHADSVIDRLVTQEGISYLKMDYNTNAGPGTHMDAFSVGDGLLEHNRAYLAWLDRVFARYPWLTIENCAGGGQRMEYALLSRHSLQTLTNQKDPALRAAVAMAAPAAVAPEQAGMWCAPCPGDDAERVVLNMVNALLLRPILSGALDQLSPEQQALVKEGLEVYQGLREDLCRAVPFWPLGLTGQDGWYALGLSIGSRAYLAVWRGEAEKAMLELPMPSLAGVRVQTTCLYPGFAGQDQQWLPEESALRVNHAQKHAARLYRLNW